jgi:hypothetical protein
MNMLEVLMNASKIHPMMELLVYTTIRGCVSTSQARYGQSGSEAMIEDLGRKTGVHVIFR